MRSSMMAESKAPTAAVATPAGQGSALNPRATRIRYAGPTNSVYRAGPKMGCATRE
jgi:hypothetical protein